MPARGFRMETARFRDWEHRVGRCSFLGRRPPPPRGEPLNFGPAPKSDHHLSVQDGDEIETRARGSRFLGQCFRVVDETAARKVLELVRKRHYDATHHCSAWRIGNPADSLERSDDDGEPSQTAGQPILQAIQGETLFDALVVVTRYFGGTKLGTGGLIRAYAAAAQSALQSARRLELVQRARLEVRCGFEDVGRVEAELGRNAVSLIAVERRFEAEPLFAVDVFPSAAEGLRQTLVEATAGRAKIHRDNAQPPVERPL